MFTLSVEFHLFVVCCPGEAGAVEGAGPC
jgi:hypothetical protein